MFLDMHMHMKTESTNLFLWERSEADFEMLGVECDLARDCHSNVTLFGAGSARMSDLKLK